MGSKILVYLLGLLETGTCARCYGSDDNITEHQISSVYALESDGMLHSRLHRKSRPDGGVEGSEVLIL